MSQRCIRRSPTPRRQREDRLTLKLEGRAVPLLVRRSPLARQLVLRIDAKHDTAVVTIPPRVPIRQAVEMAEDRAEWILRLLDQLPPRVPFADGAFIPLLGEERRLRFHPGRRGTAWEENGEIHVAGPAEHLKRRLIDWLRRKARAEIVPRVHEKAARIDRTFKRVILRDTHSRWGSCAFNGDLSFCWRLVMAPVQVLDYVVAHEVAHLLVNDHSPRFWRQVAALTDDMESSRAWLRDHGGRLHRYG
jgi:predicted metal-dependent hydrolase